jgi:hypothetical protein
MGSSRACLLASLIWQAPFEANRLLQSVDEQIVVANTENDIDGRAVWVPGVDNLLKSRNQSD